MNKPILGAGWDACMASVGRPAAQDGVKALMARGFHKPGDVENRLGYYLGQIALGRILYWGSQGASEPAHTVSRSFIWSPLTG